MSRQGSLLGLLGFVLVILSHAGQQPSSALAAHAKANDDPLEELKEDSPVRALFESFRDKTHAKSMSFPKLAWSDVPDLMTMAASEKMLEQFPINPLSSQRQFTAHEGTVALWLVEGIRQGKGFPSLNALCFSSTDDKSLSWQLRSDTNHSSLEKRYRDWWDKASELEEDEAKKLDPLEKSGLHWY